jgi:hypothetical protein
MPSFKNKTHLLIGLIVIICIAGSFLRLYFYALGRSLWLDEASLALNIVNRSFSDLLEPLDTNQGAPLGFLLLQKTITVLLGDSDLALRLVPLFAGLLSIPLMYLVANKFNGKFSFPSFITLGLFIVSAKLVYYSSELKQYSTDVLTALLLLLVVTYCLEDPPELWAFVALGVGSCMALWISHPSLFVVGGIIFTLVLTYAIKRDRRRIYWLLGVGVAYLANLCFIYFFNLRYLESNNNLIDYWAASFAPLPPWNNWGWYSNAFLNMLKDPATLPTSVITWGIIVLGIFSFAIKRWQFMLILLAPFLLTLFFSTFEKYPFSGRLILFLLPFLFLLLAEGIEKVRHLLMKINRPAAGMVVAILVMYFLLGSLKVAYMNIKSPPMGEDIKPVMAFIRDNRKSTDSIYVYYGARQAFEFYASTYGFNNYIISPTARNEPARYLEDIQNMKDTQHIWFVFSHNCSWCTVNERDFILEYLNQNWVKEAEFESSDASTYLFSMKQKP